MTTLQAQQMVSSARKYLVGLREAGIFGDQFSGTLAYRQAWQLLFAAENLISDPDNYHYQAILSGRLLPSGARACQEFFAS
jgi:hypothetical protein